ncbi:MAG: type II toxin-antitoxin system prevent-host-death family antitoxin [Bacilli bacterium]|nr:type II toxin-antitoxin system prevent-host-death family antitoxin [Bacilli bacterium]
MSITVTELRENLSKYLALSTKEDFYITKNGKIISKLSNPYRNRIDAARNLFGIIDATIDEENVKDERLSKI